MEAMKRAIRPQIRPRSSDQAMTRSRPTAAAALLLGMLLSIPFVALALAEAVF